MQAITANVVVDIGKPPVGTIGTALFDEIGCLEGVRGIRRSTRAPRLVLVDYDPKLIDSRKILSVLQHRGLDVRLIGM